MFNARVRVRPNPPILLSACRVLGVRAQRSWSQNATSWHSAFRTQTALHYGITITVSFVSNALKTGTTLKNLLLYI
jgi:hypothetical protein